MLRNGSPRGPPGPGCFHDAAARRNKRPLYQLLDQVPAESGAATDEPPEYESPSESSSRGLARLVRVEDRSQRRQRRLSNYRQLGDVGAWWSAVLAHDRRQRGNIRSLHAANILGKVYDD